MVHRPWALPLLLAYSGYSPTAPSKKMSHTSIQSSGRLSSCPEGEYLHGEDWWVRYPCPPMSTSQHLYLGRSHVCNTWGWVITPGSQRSLISWVLLRNLGYLPLLFPPSFHSLLYQPFSSIAFYGHVTSIHPRPSSPLPNLSPCFGGWGPAQRCIY